MKQPGRMHLITWGCQMNVYDSARMGDVLADRGYTTTPNAADADLVILNTCHIRDRAAEKVFSELGRLRKMQVQAEAAGSRMILAVAGCVAQAEGEQILARAPYVDLVFGPQTYHRLPAMLDRVAAGQRVIETEFPAEDKFDFLPETMAPQTPRGLTAFLTIQEGCDKFCSFCVVPYTRGAESSRPAAAVLAEARRLTAMGAREITLLGQNVNAWHGESPTGGPWSFGRLLHALADIPGLLRIRYTTSHPRDMGDDLISAHRDIPALMPFLHLPVQSGSDRILAAMNRRHTAADFLRVVDRLRDARPDLAFSSDFIVGHPGETEEDFAATIDLIEKVGFSSAFSFAYSPRPGTPAAKSSDQVPEPDKDRRLQELQAVLRRQQEDFNAASVGREMKVLFTGPGRRPGQIGGRSPYLQPVHVDGPASLIGTEQSVTIVHARPSSLFAMLTPVSMQPRSEERACA